MFSGGGGFKRGVIGLSGLVRLSEDTSGESVKSPFRRVSSAAMASSFAHAESDWLVRPPPINYAQLRCDQRPGPQSYGRGAHRRRSARAGNAHAGPAVALVATVGS